MKKVKEKQSLKRVVIFTSLILLAVCFFCFATSALISHFNYRHNIVVENSFLEIGEDGYVHKQNKTQDFRYGFFASDDKGCGWIATYNALKKLNNPQSISSIISKYDLYGENLFGLLGTNPFAVSFYFKSLGYKTTITFNTNDFEQNIKSNSASIICYLSFQSGHYQFIEHLTEDTYKVYNSTYQTTLTDYLNSHKNSLFLLISIS